MPWTYPESEVGTDGFPWVDVSSGGRKVWQLSDGDLDDPVAFVCAALQKMGPEQLKHVANLACEAAGLELPVKKGVQ